MAREMDSNRLRSSAASGVAPSKQKLPETKFFYAIAMKRSAEIKSSGESASAKREEKQ